MELTQLREPSVNSATLSRLLLDDKFVCDILEDQVREIPGQSVASWKVYGQTAIPMGRYRISFQSSVKFGPNTLVVNNVPGYVGILIHGGNTSLHTEGCLLPGTRNSAYTVGDSQKTLANLKTLIQAAIARGEQVWWTIKESGK
jgi:hypothetical protein